MMCEKDPREQERDELDLELENQALRKDLEIRGMFMQKMSEDLPAEAENTFLHNVELMEDAMEHPVCKVRDLFSEDVRFPAEEEIDDDQLEKLMERIESTLAAHQIHFGFNEAVPKRAIYRHFLDEVLGQDVFFDDPPEGFSWILDGCTGCCPECFQRDYCETAKEYDNLE